MSRRGRRASLPQTVHHRPDALDGGGLVVEHRDLRDGSVRSYDFSALPVTEAMQRSLASLFAARCRPRRWESVETSTNMWEMLRVFAIWLAALPESPHDVDAITTAVWSAWKLSRTTRVGGYHQVTRVGALLIDDPRVVGEVAEAMGRRIPKPRAQETSYTNAEFDQIKSAARRVFRSALMRIEDNARHLEQWRAGAFSEGGRDWLIGEALDCLARTGHVPCRPRGRGELSVVPRYARALGGGSKQHTWQRLYLTRLEATSLGVLLMTEFGLNLSVIHTLSLPRASPDSGPDGHPTYRLELVKRKRGSGQHHETRNVTDLGSGSPGRLITQALAATRFAREAVEAMAPGTNRLIIWRTGTPRRGTGVGAWFRLGIGENSAADWGQLAGVAVGSPFRRGRRTVNVVERREPGQNSQGTHDTTYIMPDARAREAAAPVIAAAAEAARRQAEQVVLAAELRDAPVAGDVSTATADCRDFEGGLFPGPDGRCGASFLACLGCTNARIHPGHHSRLAHLHHALTYLRSAMNSTLWQADWGETHARLEHLSRLLGPAAWTKALTEVTDDDRDLIDDLLTGGLSA
ncbi:hypothetical protein [Streptomyces sp. NBC_00105]|uniref:hypothetical protein n=1 Tax=Streptomyces sp. NBC_00105 TaxID=2903622 RepID=UPI00325531BD